MRKIVLFGLVALLSAINTTGQQFNYLPDVFSVRTNSSAIANAAGTSAISNMALPVTIYDQWTGYVYGTVFSTLPYSVKSAQDLIKVGINHDTPLHVAAYKYKVTFNIEYFTPGVGYGNTVAGSIPAEIIVEHNPDSLRSHQDLGVYKFSGYLKFRPVITGIYKYDLSNPLAAPTPVTGSDLARNFYVESEIHMQRYDNASFSVHSSCSSAGPDLLVGWHTLASALPCSGGSPTPVSIKPIEYELEWCYIDDYRFDLTTQTGSYAFTSGAQIPYDFRRNSTRVRVKPEYMGGQYAIPLVYEHGAIVFRVRAVRPIAGNYKEITYLPWNLPDSGSLDIASSCFSRNGYIINAPHNSDDFNWQYTISFAEGGKYKHVINYFDGALKARQTQTKINTDASSIIAVDKVYDFEGRPSLQTLPAPVNQPWLQYRGDLSLRSGSSVPVPYKAQDFDLPGCALPPYLHPLSTAAPTFQYYSSLNADTGGMQKYVPDAKGYPFTQTIYSADNTNKVLWQGGAGLEMQPFYADSLTGTRRATRYEYVRATQPELDRVLGTEAGYYGYYPKQVVTDPNGQSSLSILDPSGKVVVTGLLGIPDTAKSPIALLSNYVAGDSSCFNVLAGLNQARIGEKISAENTFYAEKNGPHKIKYSVAIPAFNTGCPNKFLWTRASYHVDVTTDCGVPVMSIDSAVGKDSVVATAIASYNAPPALTQSLTKGKYIISKELSFSKYDIRNQVDTFIRNNQPSCFKTENQFVHAAVDAAKFPCIDSPGLGPCEMRRQQMIREMHPGAKYGPYTKNLAGEFKGGAPNSIFTVMTSTAPGPGGLTLTNGVLAFNTGKDIMGANIPPNTGLFNDPHYTYSYDDVSYTSCQVITTGWGTAPDGTNNRVSSLSKWDQGPVYYKTNIYVDNAAADSVFLYLQADEPAQLLPWAINHIWVNGIFQEGLQWGTKFRIHNLVAGWNEIKFLTINWNWEGCLLTEFESRAAVGHYKYQDPCLTLPASVWKDGVQYTNLASLPVEKFIEIFNDTVAEALLTLHPEYCKLALCDDGTFERQIEGLQTFKQAEAVDRFILDSLVANDPLYYKSPAIQQPAVQTALLTFKNLNKRIDSLAIQQAYCNTGHREEAMHCISYLYPGQIASLSFINDTVKQRYFELLKQYYLVNRTQVLQQMLDTLSNACPTCAPLRLEQVGEPVFPSLYGPGNAIDTSLHLPPWMASIYQNAVNGDTTGMTALAASIQDSVNAINAALCAGQIDAIVTRLVNCTLDTVTLPGHPLYTVKTFLQGRCGTTNGAPITPATVDSALAAASLSKTDLCHPFLVPYKVYDAHQEREYRYSCGDSALYAGLTTFLNQPAIKSAIADATTPAGSGTIYSLALSAGNHFEQRLIGKLGASAVVGGFLQQLPGALSISPQYVKLRMTNAGGDSVVLYVRAKDLTNAAELNGSTAVAFNWSKCINEYPGAATEGILTAGSAVVNATVSGNTYDYYLWTKELRLMSPVSDASLAGCVTCLDIKAAVIAFHQQAAVYAYDTVVNHPLYESTLTNYLNHALGKNFTYDEYTGLMDGCALSDKMVFKKYLATYRLGFAGQGQWDAFMYQLNAFTGGDTANIFRYRLGSDYYANIDLNTVSKDRLLAYKVFLDGAYPGYWFAAWLDRTYRFGLGVDVILTAPAAGCAAPSYLSTYGTLSAGSTLDVWDGATYVPTHQYEFTPSATTPYGHAQALAGIRSALTAACPSAYWISNRHLFRSADYNTPAKQQYLAHIYGLDGLGRDRVIAGIAPDTLRQQLSAFAAKTVTYGDPLCSKRKRDVYLYSKIQSAHPGYATAASTLNAVETAGAFFPATVETSINPNLKVFRKANGDYWYRFFDAAHKMYNLYVTPPKHMEPNLTLYVLDSVRVAQGHDSSRRFTAYVHHSTLGYTVACSGHTDFTVGYSQRVEGVVLRNGPGADYCYDRDDCEQGLLTIAVRNGQAAYAYYFDSTKTAMSDSMVRFVVANARDTLQLCAQQQQYQYTLYYYDRAGNLTRTVPPAGVTSLAPAALGAVGAARDNSNIAVNSLPGTAHKKVSTYRYNIQNKVVYQRTPDGGETYFFYDGAGRLVFSQNSKQRPTGHYSYTLYDRLSRVTETGQVKLGCTLPASSSTFDTTHCSFTVGGTTVSAVHPPYVAHAHNDALYPMDSLVKYVRTKAREEVVLTVYDTAKADLAAVPSGKLSGQTNLLNRVSAIAYFPGLSAAPAAQVYKNPTSVPYFTTHYSYDLTGNVKTITYDYPSLANVKQQYKRVDYDYDLLSGKVNLVSYNRGWADQFYHRYEYDADNRITEAYTSSDGVIWNKDARYTYYKHGPLARVRIGDAMVQSIEYAYTINGWLKAINGQVLRPDHDMGGAGAPGDLTYARDVIAHALDYFPGDYRPIDTTVARPTVMALPGPDLLKGLYNGNIARTTTSIATLGAQQRNYKYDQLGRLKEAANSAVDETALTVASPTAYWKSSYAYDPDGNITALQRWDGLGAQIDNFTYHYPAGGNDNRLQKVTDAATSPGTYTDLKGGQTDSNYRYDRLGNLVSDKQEKLVIDWTLYGKVKSIRDTGAGGETILFSYDGAGNRIYKDVVRKTGPLAEAHRAEYYVRDGGGNILAVYGLRSQYEPKHIIKVIHGGIKTHAASLLDDFLLTEVSPTWGTFDGALLTSALRNNASGWVNSLVAAKPVSFYLRADDELLNRMLFGSDAYLDELADWSAQSEAPIFGEALVRDALAGEEVLSEALHTPEHIARPVLQHFAGAMPVAVAHSFWQAYELPFEEGDPQAAADVLYGFMNDHGMHGQIARHMAAVCASDFEGGEGMAFYTAVVGDPAIFTAAELRDGETRFEYALSGALYRDGNREHLYSFFDAWDRSRQWLDANTSLDGRLSTVFAANKGEVVNAYLTSTPTDALDEVVAGIEGLLAGDYYKKVIGSTIPWPGDPVTWYDPFAISEVKDTAYLAEHHLYGSARLGVQRYDSARYVNTWAQDGSIATVKLLSTRRTWHSAELGDWIDTSAAEPFTIAAGAKDNTRWYTDRSIGRKHFEMSDHLGNVLATVLDRKTGQGAGGVGTLYTHWAADLPSVTDYYPYGMMMSGRWKLAGDSNKFRFGYQGQHRNDEVGGNGNHYAATFWEMDPRIARRWNVDPKYYLSFSQSPMSVLGNNPIHFMDEHGDKEYASYDAYKKALGNKAVAQKDWRGQDGNWLQSDREDNTSRWDGANNFNLKQKEGYKQYETIEQRAGFYGWYAVKEDLRGGETVWAGAAYMVAKQMTLMDVLYRSQDLVMMYGRKDADDLNGFANAGNKAIFENVFGRLQDNMAGPPKTGAVARAWDATTLRIEQFDIVQPIYLAWTQYNPKLTNYLQKFASGSGISWFMHMPMKFKGNIMSPQDRYNHGMNVVVPFYKAQKARQGH